MDKETREYLDQKHVTLAGKDDIEKLRQETKASFRHVREENKTQLQEWKEETHARVEELRKRLEEEFGSFREDMLKEFQKLLQGTQLMFHQSGQKMELSLQKIRDEAKALHEQSEQDRDALLSSLQEAGRKDITPTIQEIRSEVNGLREGLMQIQGQFKEVTGTLEASSGRIVGSVDEVKEELGAMIRFSFADLERRLNALEARIKVLEKIVLQQP